MWSGFWTRESLCWVVWACACVLFVCVCVCVCDRKRITSLVSMCSRGNCGSLSVADHPLRSGWWAGKWFSWSFSSALGEARRGESRRSPPCAFAFNTIALYQPSSFLNQIPFFAKKSRSAAAAPPASAPAARCWRCRRPRRRPARPHSTRQRAVKMLRCRSPLVSLAPVGDREPPSRRVWCPPRPCCVWAASIQTSLAAKVSPHASHRARTDDAGCSYIISGRTLRLDPGASASRRPTNHKATHTR